MPKKYSTKNLEVLEAPREGAAGVGVFEFTDAYSVFHYGKMPDRILGKGEAIARMAAFNFELIERSGVPTHFRRFDPPDRIEFALLPTPDPARDAIEPGSGNYMIPLQVVFRNSLPQGASVFRRLEEGTVTLAQLGFRSKPQPGDQLERPLIEFTTKREEIDRFVTDEEARAIAGLSEEDVQRIKSLVQRIDAVLTEHATKVGLEHADGKVEFGKLPDGEIILVDNAGTPDENRFLFDGQHVGKQVMRDHYLAQGLERDVQEWAAAGRPRSSWPELEPLPPGFLRPMSDMYRALSERWLGEAVWGAPPLEDVIETVKLLDSGAVRW